MNFDHNYIDAGFEFALFQQYMTDGMLLREFLGEPDLASYRYNGIDIFYQVSFEAVELKYDWISLKTDRKAS